MKKMLLTAMLLTGCATADQVQNMQKEIDALKTEVETLKKSPAAAAPAAKTATANDGDEQAAQTLLREMQQALSENKVDEAKAKYTEIKSKYSSTRSYKGAAKLGAELEVFGKPAPSAFDVKEWFIGDASAINLAKGVNVLVFWEVWCPHCKKEVPNIQATFDKYKGQGLKLVGLTKMTRNKTKEDVMGFLKEKNVTYPIALEDGKLSSYFNVSGIPAAAVVKDGTIVWRGHPARLSDEMLEGWLK